MAKGFWGISWANSADPGDVVEPDGTKQNNGWEAGEKPPNHSFNWFWKKICDAFKMLNDQGVMEWDSATSYPKDAIVFHSGGMYISNQTANVNHTPSTSSIYWQSVRQPNVYIGDTEPTNGIVGNLWVKTLGGVKRLYGYFAGAPDAWLPIFDYNSMKRAVAGGSADAITAAFALPFTANADIVCAIVVAAAKNTSSAVTIAIDGLTTWPLKKLGGLDLRPGDISGAGHHMLIAVDAANSRFMLLNPSGNNRPRSIIFGHTESAGTDGGTFTSGSWVDRVLNAVFYNDGMNGSLLAFSGDTIILQPGTYDVDGWAIGFNVNRHQLVMRTAGGADHIVGSSENTTGTATGEEPTGTKSFISGRIVVTTPTTYSFKHRCSSTQATTGLGAAANFGVAEIYAQFKITEVLAN